MTNIEAKGMPIWVKLITAKKPSIALSPRQSVSEVDFLKALTNSREVTASRRGSKIVWTASHSSIPAPKPPRIDAEGKRPAAVFLKNPSYWEIHGLEITNTNGKDEDQGDLFGIQVLATEIEGVYRHVYINNCHPPR